MAIIFRFIRKKIQHNRDAKRKYVYQINNEHFVNACENCSPNIRYNKLLSVLFLFSIDLYLSCFEKMARKQFHLGFENYMQILFVMFYFFIVKQMKCCLCSFACKCIGWYDMKNTHLNDNWGHSDSALPRGRFTYKLYDSCVTDAAVAIAFLFHENLFFHIALKLYYYSTYT